MTLWSVVGSIVMAVVMGGLFFMAVLALDALIRWWSK